MPRQLLLLFISRTPIAKALWCTCISSRKEPPGAMANKRMSIELAILLGDGYTDNG